MQVDPRYGFWLSIVAAVVSALIAGAANLTDVFGASTAHKVNAVLILANTIINAVNAVLHAIPSGPGPAALKEFYLAKQP
jgi:MFS superfamily sulfate permease-like transporter